MGKALGGGKKERGEEPPQPCCVSLQSTRWASKKLKTKTAVESLESHVLPGVPGCLCVFTSLGFKNGYQVRLANQVVRRVFLLLHLFDDLLSLLQY